MCATNSNNILDRFFKTGKYDKETVEQTSSPSMDIGVSSNFERYLYYMFSESTLTVASKMTSFKTSGKLQVAESLHDQAREDFSSAFASEAAVAATIKTW